MCLRSPCTRSVPLHHAAAGTDEEFTASKDVLCIGLKTMISSTARAGRTSEESGGGKCANKYGKSHVTYMHRILSRDHPTAKCRTQPPMICRMCVATNDAAGGPACPEHRCNCDIRVIPSPRCSHRRHAWPSGCTGARQYPRCAARNDALVRPSESPGSYAPASRAALHTSALAASQLGQASPPFKPPAQAARLFWAVPHALTAS